MAKDTTEFDDWPLDLGHYIMGVEAQMVQAFVFSYWDCFAFSLKDLEVYMGKSIHIHIHPEDDHPSYASL